jgi:hypothetical protein
MESEVILRKPYPTDVSDDEWQFVAPYLPFSPVTPRRSTTMPRQRGTMPAFHRVTANGS